MGKPFKSEIEKLSKTFEWAVKVNVEEIRSHFGAILDKPLLAIGSGGSLSACYYAAMLHQSEGQISKAITPLEVYYSKEVLGNCNTLFISASGRNNDILSAYKAAVQFEPSSLVSICMALNSPIEKLSKNYSIARNFAFKVPAGKDGFLATNSLLGFFTLLCRAYNKFNNKIKFKLGDKIVLDFNPFFQKINKDFSYTVLYGGWGHPVAIDIESKFSEAALANILLSDYRNFGHGRHHWFAKRSENSAIIALVSKDEKEIAEKTLAIIPKSIPRLIIHSDLSGPEASIELLHKSFFLSEKMGQLQGIDPGKPGVPKFGSKLYHLRYSSFYLIEQSKKLPAKAVVAIQRKIGKKGLAVLSDQDLQLWTKAYSTFQKKISTTKFGGIAFDYDGTLSSNTNRHGYLDKEMTLQLERILEKGFVIGIVTGRGDSARESIEKTIKKKHWKNIIIGYYNGAEFGEPGNKLVPNKNLQTDSALQIAYEKISNLKFADKKPEIKLHQFQLTIKFDNKQQRTSQRPIVIQSIMSMKENVRVVESSHSLDVIIPGRCSKLNILKHCISKLKAKGFSENILCVGDKGLWPGNDYELLSSPFSLSVNEVTPDLDSCWNLGDVGQRDEVVTMEYLRSVKFNSDNFLLQI